MRAPALIESFEEIHNFYKECGFTIKKINHNKEFKPTLDAWYIKKEPIVKVSYTNSNNHILCIERNNYTIQERVGVAYYQLLFNYLP